METIPKKPYYFVRLEPGEKLIACLKEFATDQKVRFGSIVSGVGMVGSLDMGFFSIEKNDYDRRSFNEIMDLSSISGNITWRDGVPVPHVHVLVNRPSYESISGHLIEATCHITMEVFIRNIELPDVMRTTEVGRPATFITRKRT